MYRERAFDKTIQHTCMNYVERSQLVITTITVDPLGVLGVALSQRLSLQLGPSLSEPHTRLVSS